MKEQFNDLLLFGRVDDHFGGDQGLGLKIYLFGRVLTEGNVMISIKHR